MADVDVEALLERQLEAPAPAAPSSSASDDSKKRSRDDERKDDRKDRGERSSRSDERTRDRDRDRERDYDKDRDRSRRRSRSRSPRRDRGYSEKDSNKRRRDDEREARARREALLTPQEREAIEAERDARTVFAFNMPLRADEDTIIDFFSRAGKVRDVRLITDRNSRKSKGFGYIEFADRASVPGALSLSGTPMMGQTIQVQQTFAEKNRAASTTTTTSMMGPTRLYVGALHQYVAEDDLKLLFEPFGDIDFVQIHREPDTNRSKGYGFVQFRRSEDAKRALAQVNGLEIAGRAIKVGLVNEAPGAAPGSYGGYGGGRVDTTSMGELDDDDRGGLHMNAQSRAMLMAKLNRGAGEAVPSAVMMPMMPMMPMAPMVPPQPVFSAGGPVPTQDAPSPCVMLTNMFDPATETDPNWDQDIRQDVGEECSKFGSVVFITVDKHSAGHVYLKFGSIPGAQNAINALNRRWFSGRMITAHFVNEGVFAQRFPESRR